MKTEDDEVSRASDGSSVVRDDIATETFTMQSAWDDWSERNETRSEVMFNVLIEQLQRLRRTQGKRGVASIIASITSDDHAAESLSSEVTDGMRQYTDQFEARFDRGATIDVTITFHSGDGSSEHSSSKCSDEDDALMAR